MSEPTYCQFDESRVGESWVYRCINEGCTNGPLRYWKRKRGLLVRCSGTPSPESLQWLTCDHRGPVLKTIPNNCRNCGDKGKRPPSVEPQLNGYGPGSQLLKLWSDMPHCSACSLLAAKMDAWGKSGCTAHLDEIIADILPRAQTWMSENKPWVHKILSITSSERAVLRLGIAQKVRQAINLATGD